MTDTAVQQSCNLAPPPPPMQPLPSTPRCPSMVGEFVRYVRIGWADSSVSASTCSGGEGGHLNVAELQLIYNGYNIALGKPGTGLDVWSNNPAAYGPSKLVDGKSNTMFHSLTVSSSVYVQIDLQVGPVWLVSCEVCAVVELWSCGWGLPLWWGLCMASRQLAGGRVLPGTWHGLRQLVEWMLPMGWLTQCYWHCLLPSRHTQCGVGCVRAVVARCHAWLVWLTACVLALFPLRACCCDSLPGC